MNKIKKLKHSLYKFQILNILLLSILYFFIFSFTLKSNLFIGSSDMSSQHIPAVGYLKDNIINFDFPWWSEKFYGGFPIYAYTEYALFSPLRISLVPFFEPLNVIKIEHFMFFLFGALSFIKLGKLKGYNYFTTIAGVVVFFLGVPNIIRIVHLHIVYTMYLLPVSLLLYELHIKHKSTNIYIYLRAFLFVFVVIYGNYNAIFLSLLSEFLYLIADKRVLLKVKIRYTLGSGLLGLILSLPLILPALLFFLDSSRQGGALDPTQGSYNALSLLTGLYPFFLGTYETYIGTAANDRWFFIETVMYFGAVGMLGALVKSVFIDDENSNEVKFFNYSLLLFIFLSTVGAISSLDISDVPFYNLFRYWGRSQIIFLFSLAILISSFKYDSIVLPDLRNIIPILRRLSIYVLTLVYLLIIHFNSEQYFNTVILDNIRRGLYFGDPYKKYWALLILVSFFVMFMWLIKNRFSKYAFYGFVLLIIIDVLVFSKIIVNTQVYNFSDYFDQRVYDASLELKNKRVAYSSDKLQGNAPMLYESWHVFGYGPFLENLEYKTQFETQDLSVRRLKDESNYIRNKEFFKSIGVVALIDERGDIDKLSDEDLELVKGTLSAVEGFYTTKEEGHIVFQLNSQEKQDITVLVRNYPGWRANVNSKNVEIVKDGLYSRVPIQAGTNLIEFRYYPIYFYYSLLISSVLLILYWLILKSHPKLLKRK